MNPTDWQRLKDIFEAAVEREPGERIAFVEQVCAGDSSLRAELLSLLASFDRAGSFIEPPPRDPTTASPDEVASGQRVGAYQLLHEIGQGGMGAVYLAARVDLEYQKRVAVKVMRAGLKSRAIIRRMQQERQTLAALDHPNIVKLLDGGTTPDGLPFLVMDYVEGTPIDQHCEARRMSTTERLRLFLGVCAAVQYAHQNLVVHRDLKPSNILVTPDGVPKLLDFGIAKLLNPEFSATPLAATQTAERPMTLEYASPEQVRGEPITTATDVYALGVVLYQLLTGQSPYGARTSSPIDLERAICEIEPEKPSTAITRVDDPHAVSSTREGHPDRLRKRLKGDLDMIVLMALRKEPQRRYASVEQLAEDLRRHLAGLPVIARNDTLGYRASKFWARHRVGVAATVLLMLTLVAGVAGVGWEAAVARAERTRAERRFNDVRKLANSMLFEFHDAVQNLPGSTAARQLLVKRALEYVDSLALEASGDETLELELAMAYQRVGDVQGNPNNPNLGDSVGALESYRKAQAIREVIVAAHPANVQAVSDLSITHERIGDILRRTKGPVEALESYRRNLALNEALSSGDPDNARFRRNVSVSHNKLGYVRASMGDLTGAQTHYYKALEIAEALSAQDPASETARRDLAIGYDNVGDILLKNGDPDRALASYEKKRQIFEELARANPQHTPVRRGLLVSYVKIGEAFGDAANLPAAAESFRKAVAIAEALANEDRNNVGAQDDLAITYAGLAAVLSKTHKRIEALENHRRALTIFERLAAGDPANSHFRLEVAQALVDVAALLAETRQADAHRLALRGLAILKSQAERAEAVIAELRAAAAAFLTCEPANLRDPAAALRYAQRAADKTGAKDPTILITLARAFFQNGDAIRALETAEHARTLLPDRESHGPATRLARELVTDLARFEAAVKKGRTQ